MARRLRALQLISPEHHCKGFAGDVDLAKALHALLAASLLGKELLFAAHITAVEITRDIFAVGTNIFAGNELPTDRRLQCHLKALAWHNILELLHHLAPQPLRLRAVTHNAERINHLASHVEIHAHQILRLVAP